VGIQRRTIKIYKVGSVGEEIHTKLQPDIHIEHNIGKTQLFHYNPLVQLITTNGATLMSRSSGTYRFLSEAGLHLVRYDDPWVLQDCQYTLDAHGTATLQNMASAARVTNPNATLDITFDGKATKRFSAAWSELVPGEDHWIKAALSSTGYPGLTQAFYVMEPDNTGRRRAGVACGATKIGEDLYMAKRLVMTACLDPYPIPGVDSLPVTHYIVGTATERLAEEEEV